MTTVHIGEVPEQAPAQFENVLPSGGVATRITADWSVNLAEQFPPQFSARSLPDGVATTVPGLERPTESVYCFWKVAFTTVLPLMLAEQVKEVPPHAPLQPVKTLPPGLAVRLTVAPFLAKTAQTLPQLMLPPATMLDAAALPSLVTFKVSGITLAALF